MITTIQVSNNNIAHTFLYDFDTIYFQIIIIEMKLLLVC